MSDFHGTELASASVGGVRYRTVEFPASFATSPHEHEEAYFCLVLEGCSSQRSGRSERARDRGRAYFYPAGERQSERFGSRGSRLFSIELGATTVARLGEAGRLPRVSAELAGPTALAVRRLYLELQHGDPLGIEDQTLQLVGAQVRERCEAVRWAPVVREFLHAHCTEKLTLQRIARVAGLHPVHLCRDFPRRFGRTLGDYLRALRVDRAARELVVTERPIADIALEAGFSSQSHLTREMKRTLGTTPASYRRR